MTTSERTGRFVWVWLPTATTPVAASVWTWSRAAEDDTRCWPSPTGVGTGPAPTPSRSSYQSSRCRQAPSTRYVPPTPGREALPLAGCLRDAAPDAWGRRVVNLQTGPDPDVELFELTYLLGSASDRVGGLDFQASATEHVARGGAATLDQLVAFSDLVETGAHIPSDLAAAAGHGTSIGGARPKALLEHEGRPMIAKFSSSTDTRPVVQAEALATLPARRVGIEVPDVRVVRATGKKVLLVDCFDRTPSGARRLMVSGLTVLGLGESSARCATYPMLADAIRTSFDRPSWALDQLYRRLVLNLVVGNNDDHLRNVAAFCDGRTLDLTPAYDLTPQPRSTAVSSQAIAVTDDGGRASQLRVVRRAAPAFLLGAKQAAAIVAEVVDGVRRHFDEAADQARLTSAERATLLGREILNPYVFCDEP